MKRLFIPLIAVLLLSCAQSPANAQGDKEKAKEEKQKAKEVEREERQKTKEVERLERYKKEYPEEFKTHISKEFAVSKSVTSSVLAIYNVTGPIKVEGYSGDKVLIEIDETISGKTTADLETGKKEFKLGFDQIGDTVAAFIAAPYDSRPHQNYNNGYNYWDEDRKRIEYRYHLAFTVKVPFNMNLNISTVNDGNVTVENVAGMLRVRNVNGSISIKNAKNTTDAKTINGDLTVNYLNNPTEASSYYTLNGKLTVTYQPNLSADLQFKSMNGEFYTDFPDAQVLPTKVNLTKDKKNDGTIYRINKNSDVRIGSGGKVFKFETLNGNIYIQKQS